LPELVACLCGFLTIAELIQMDAAMVANREDSALFGAGLERYCHEIELEKYDPLWLLTQQTALPSLSLNFMLYHSELILLSRNAESKRAFNCSPEFNADFRAALLVYLQKQKRKNPLQELRLQFGRSMANVPAQVRTLSELLTSVAACCSSLQTLDIEFDWNNLDFPLLQHLLLSLPRLRTLRIMGRNAPFSRDHVKDTLPLLSLASVRLRSLELHAVPFMLDLQRATQLRTLQLFYMSIFDREFADLPFAHLAVLDISNCDDLTRASLNHIAQHGRQLVQLRVEGCRQLYDCDKQFQFIVQNLPTLQNVVYI